MKKKSLVMMLTSLGLVGTVMVGATLAYFTDYTQAVTNTFSVGANVGIELLEDVKQTSENEKYIENYATLPADKIVQAGLSGKTVKFQNMYPKLTLNKKPFVQKSANTSDCYVIIKVTGINDLEAAGFSVDINTGIWEKVSTTAGDDGTYRYNTKLTADDATTPNVDESKTPNLFETVTYNSNNSAPTTVPAAGIQMKAYAMQADGFTSAAAAFADPEGVALLTN